jgi:Cu(I)/Ag(I) efflux system protein CusF
MRKAFLILAALILLHTACAEAAEIVQGEVKAIDTSARMVTLKHGPIKSLGMDMDMTMMFHVVEPAMLKELKTGDRVTFQADNVNGRLTVIAIQKSK